MDHESKITKEQLEYEGKWIRVFKKNFTIGQREVKDYECVERNKKEKHFKEFDGVTIAPILYNTPDNIKKLILIAQFRPPAGRFILEFPAGLVDDDNLLQNAERELKEETGYVMDKENIIDNVLISNLPITIDDPGISSGSGKFLMVKINYKDERNQNSVKQELEHSENIRVHVVNFDYNLQRTLIDLAENNDYWISGKLFSFAAGYCLSQQMSKF